MRWTTPGSTFPHGRPGVTPTAVGSSDSRKRGRLTSGCEMVGSVLSMHDDLCGYWSLANKPRLSVRARMLDCAGDISGVRSTGRRHRTVGRGGTPDLGTLPTNRDQLRTGLTMTTKDTNIALVEQPCATCGHRTAVPKGTTRVICEACGAASRIVSCADCHTVLSVREEWNNWKCSCGHFEMSAWGTGADFPCPSCKAQQHVAP